MRVHLNRLNLILLTLLSTGMLSQISSAAENPPAPAGSPPAASPAPAAPAAPAATTTPAEAYAAERDQWNSLTGQMEALAGQFREAAPDQRDAIRGQYMQLISKADAALPRLRQTAIAAYKAAPNVDQELPGLLLGLSANDLRNDRNSAALELTELLIANDCPEKAVYVLAGTAAYGTDDFAKAQKYLQAAKDAELLDEEGLMYLTDASLAQKLWDQEQQLRRAESQADDLPRVLLKTSKGDLVVELYENEAPQAVGNFVSLVESGFYDGLPFHRVLPGFMAQGGCPKGDGTGGPGYEIYCECYKPEHRKHFLGTLSMAHAGKDTGGSQFFITFRRTSHLDGRHTAFGRVVEGLDVLEKLQRIDPQAPSGAEPDKIVEARVVRKRDHQYQPTKVR